MFAVAKYKTIEVFEFQGIQYGLGQELYLEDADGEMLVQKHLTVLVRYLDPEVPEDKSIIDEVDARQVDQSPVAGNSVTTTPKRSKKKSV